MRLRRHPLDRRALPGPGRAPLALLAALACQGAPPADDEGPIQPVGVEEHVEGMWAARALTVKAGLDEALALQAAGDRAQAAEHVMAVYRGSFEPELEPAIREHLDPRLATELEFGFGRVRDGVGGRKPDEALARVAALDARLREVADQLDGARATLRPR